VHWTNAKGRRTKQGELTRNRPRTGGLTENETGRTNRENEQGGAHWTGGDKEDHEQKQRGGLFQTQNSNTGEDNKQNKNRKTEKKDQKKRRRNRGAPADQVSLSFSLPVLYLNSFSTLPFLCIIIHLLQYL
jgi:hypothetical protein